MPSLKKKKPEAVNAVRKTVLPKLAARPDSARLSFKHSSTSTVKLLRCACKMEPNMGLTCWPLDAVGVDLNSQNEENRAGVHGVAVLVLSGRAGVTISFR